MTAYFDAMGCRLDKIREASLAAPDDFATPSKALEVLEEEVVRDVSVASEMPGLLESLRDDIHAIVLRRGVQSRPLNDPHPGFDTVEEHVAAIGSLLWDLHTVFHEIARADLANFSDDPRMPIRVLCGRAEQRREEMAAKEKA